MAYLDETGLSRVWAKMKAYVDSRVGGGCPFPVNGIYMSMDATDPSTIWANTAWVQIAQGRTLIGVDASDTDFNAANKSGGAKTHTHTTGGHTLTVDEIPSHTHTAQVHMSSGSGQSPSGLSYVATGYNNTTFIRATGGGGSHSHGNTGSASNVPPYLTCYIWKRTN